MKGIPVRFGDFVVYPEYCELDLLELLEKSRGDGKYHIAALPHLGGNFAVVSYAGSVVYKRAKYRLFKSERGLVKGDRKPETVMLGSQRVLILVCYELVFPQDYLLENVKKVDMVVHMVGFPMFDENQREGWVALQQSLALVYQCPVVCCCGGGKGRMNISGVVRP